MRGPPRTGQRYNSITRRASRDRSHARAGRPFVRTRTIKTARAPAENVPVGRVVVSQRRRSAGKRKRDGGVSIARGPPPAPGAAVAARVLRSGPGGTGRRAPPPHGYTLCAYDVIAGTLSSTYTNNIFHD